MSERGELNSFKEDFDSPKLKTHGKLELAIGKKKVGGIRDAEGRKRRLKGR